MASAGGVASKGIEVPEPVYLTMLTPPSASGLPVLNLGSAPPRYGGRPVVFSIGGAAPAPRSSDGGVKDKDSTGKDAAAADPRPERDIPISKIFTTADVLDLDVLSESGIRHMLMAVAEDNSKGSMAEFSSRGCWVSKEDGDAIQLKVDVPGLRKEQVKVRVEKDALVIKGEGDKDSKGGYDKVPAQYNYRIGLPSSQAFKMDQIKAEVKNGVLMVTLPTIKDEERKDAFEIKVE